MKPWTRGEATIREFLDNGQLQRVTGEMTDEHAWLNKAGRTLTTSATTFSTPSFPGDLIVTGEAKSAVATVQGFLEAATALLPELGRFS